MSQNFSIFGPFPIKISGYASDFYLAILTKSSSAWVSYLSSLHVQKLLYHGLSGIGSFFTNLDVLNFFAKL